MENKEKYITSQINNHREAVDTDELWANLSGAIPQKEEKKRRGVIWFWGGLLLFTLVSFSGYILVGDSMKNGDLKESPKEKVILQEPTAQIAEVATSEKDKGGNEPLKNKIDSNSEQYNKNRNSNKQKGLRNNKNAKRSLISNGDRLIKNNSNQSIKVLVENKEISLLAPFSNKDFVKDEEVVFDDVDMTYNDLESIPFGKGVAKRNDMLSPLSPLGFGLFDFHRDLLSIEKKEFIKVDLNSEKAKKLARWSTFFNAGVSSVSRELATIDTEFSDTQNRRNLAENVVGGWDATMGLNYQISPSFGISSGISIGQIHEQATYSTSYQLESEEEGITTIIHTQDGSINSLSGNVTKYTNRETNEIRNNTIRYFSIPAIVKFRVLENKTYRLSLNGNAAYSFSQRYNGFISLDGNQPAYDLTSDLRNDFVKSGGLSYGFGLEAGRNISQKWNVNIGVGMKYLKGISSHNNPIQQEYKLYNLTFGISRKI